MKTFKLVDLLDARDNLEFVADYHDAQGVVHSVTVWTTLEFYTITRSKYNHMLFDSFEADETQSEEAAYTAAKAELMTDLYVFKALNETDYAKAVYAMGLYYNPLENYDRYEEGKEIDAKHKGSVTTETITEAGTETNAHHKGSKVSVGEETIVTPRVQTKNTTYKVPFDTSSEVETDALVSEPVSGTDKTERDATKNFTKTEDLDSSTFDRDERSFSQDRATTRTTEAADKSATVFDKDVREYDGRRTHGNIGVTTAQQMLDAEMELRTRGFREGLIRRFIGEYCYYVKGVE